MNRRMHEVSCMGGFPGFGKIRNQGICFKGLLFTKLPRQATVWKTVDYGVDGNPKRKEAADAEFY